MPNFKLTIEYDGTNYFGWQRQKGSKRLPTIQSSVEKAVKRIFGREIPVVAAGRTDTGVHSLGQVANFEVDTRLSPSEIQRALNAYLPDDIRIREVREAPQDFHARYGAKSKWYRYTILNSNLPSAFHRYYALHYPYPLDLMLMKKAGGLLKGRHDFSGIIYSGSKNKAREIYRLDIKKDGDFIYIDVVGDGFLYKMVRRLVGLLIDAGRGKKTLEDIREILSGSNLRFSIQTVPPNGLVLMSVEY